MALQRDEETVLVFVPDFKTVSGSRQLYFLHIYGLEINTRHRELGVQSTVHK
jgi:hypothetical protein